MESSDSPESFDDDTMKMLSANLPSSAFSTSTPDPRLERAREEMERTKNITPVLKEELRLRILAKRLQKGEPELETTSGEPKKYELTEEEKEKRERRKAQNRRAAKKCRQKRKMKNLSDAEKNTLMQQENQKLKNEVTLLRHKKEIFERFWREHNGQCPMAQNDPSIQNLQMVWLQATTAGTDVLRNVEASSSSAPDSVPTSLSAGPSSTAQDVILQVSSSSQVAASNADFHDLSPQEISSLLPPPNTFDIISDHSSESTPDLSPTTLFSNTSPGATVVATSSFFVSSPSTSFSSMNNPSTSFSSLNNPSTSFSSMNNPNTSFSSSDNTPSSLNSSGNVTPSLFNSSGNSSSTSASDVPQLSCTSFLNIDTGHSHTTSDYQLRDGSHQEHHSAKEGPSSADTMTVSLLSTGQYGGQIQSSSFWATATNETAASDASNDVIINTALFGDFAGFEQVLDQSYLIIEQNPHLCQGNHDAHTGPISPLTPLSPPSPHVTLSPNTLAGEIPNPQLIDSTSVTTGRILRNTAAISPSPSSSSKPDTPASRLVRRVSSTASVTSPVTQQLSPPPSVPSPSSHGVPESPSILAGFPGCDELQYILPQVSPVSSMTSAQPSPAILDFPEDEFNTSL